MLTDRLWWGGGMVPHCIYSSLGGKARLANKQASCTDLPALTPKPYTMRPQAALILSRRTLSSVHSYAIQSCQTLSERPTGAFFRA